MNDLNHDGVEDYRDDIFYMENIENDIGDIDDNALGGIDDIDYGTAFTDDGINPTNEGADYIPDDITKSNINRTPRRMSGGLAFLVRMLIVGVLIFICAAFSQLLAFVVLIGWGLMEMYS